MNNITLLITFAVVIQILTACGGDNTQTTSIDSVDSVELLPAINKITPRFSSSANNAVQAMSAVDSIGAFAQPFEGETFTGNILVSISAQDPDGLASVALSFNNSTDLKYLCESGDDCPAGIFSKTETNINPADYGVYVGPLTIGLWTLDSLGNQMLVDSLTLDWQLRRIQGANVTRSNDGTRLDISWQNEPSLLRYNVLVAAQSGVTLANYTELNEGQALLSLTQSLQSITGLSSSQTYFVMISGVDGSGESAFSSEYRMVPPSGSINTVPVVISEVISANQNQMLIGNVLSNDSDLESDLLSISPLPIQFPLNGEVLLARDGSFSYTPAMNFSGQDSFVYEVQDGQGGISQGIVTITVDDVNDPPQALRNNYSTEEGYILTVDAPGILANDSDIDGDTLQVNTTPIVPTINGSLTLLADGSFSYEPFLYFTGLDFFIYQITDPLGLTAEARVDIKVGSGNIAPIAVNDNYLIDEDQTLIINASATNSLLANDYDLDNDTLQLEMSLINTVTNGVLTIDSSGGFTYIPNANFYGRDSFTYQINDGQSNTAQATVTIAVEPINDTPSALDDSYTIDSDNTLVVNAPGLLSNDSDNESDALSLVAVASSDVAFSINGQAIYTPQAEFFGVKTIAYTVEDTAGNQTEGQWVITVTQVHQVKVKTSGGGSINFFILALLLLTSLLSHSYKNCVKDQ